MYYVSVILGWEIVTVWVERHRTSVYARWLEWASQGRERSVWTQMAGLAQLYQNGGRWRLGTDTFIQT